MQNSDNNSEKKQEKIATRAAYGAALQSLGETNNELVVLDADLSKSTSTRKFADKYPERFFNMGIAEANMMGVAAGLAACGKKVFVSTFAIFATGRAWEQIRNTVCYGKLNVKIAASHAGLGVGPDGASHQMNEDIALMTSIPGMVVIEPCDGPETKKAVEAVLNYDGPVYLRLGRPAIPVITNEKHGFEIGKGITLREGKDVTIVACGMLVDNALKAANSLSEQGIDAGVVNIHTIKPLDRELLLSVAEKTKAIVTAEQHVLNGGLGNAVSSFLSGKCAVPIEMVGIDNRYGQSGEPSALFEEYNLTTNCIVEAAGNAVKRKNTPN